MQLIRCTRKLQKEMGARKADITNNEATFSCLGSWHANLIFINGKKCVLFINDKTQFNFIVAGVSRVEIKNLSKMFIENLHRILTDEGLGQATMTKIFREYDELHYTATNSKRILGTMNDLAFHYTSLIQEAGDVHSYLVPSIIKKLNRIPLKAINYNFPIEMLHSMYACHH